MSSIAVELLKPSKRVLPGMGAHPLHIARKTRLKITARFFIGSINPYENLYLLRPKHKKEQYKELYSI